ncbi:MAG: thioesterase, partial [Thermoprotei archaeon]
CTTVGTAVNIKHVNPAPRGAKVLVETTIVEVRGRRILFKAKAPTKDT